MNRLVDLGFREPISTAWARLTPALQDRLQHVHFLTGSDPFYVGLHLETPGSPRHYTFADGKTVAYADLAHCSYPHHQEHLSRNDRRTTVVLPNWHRYKDPVSVVVHELGHALHESVGWDWIAEPVTDYARENRYEAFAEAFEETVMATPIAPLVDELTRALFERLS